MKTTVKKEIVSDKNLVAYCGLYCGACGTYLKGKCPGCRDNVKATWCKIKKCCADNNLESCAGCKKVEVPDCEYYNTFLAKIISFAFNSDRKACINRIRELGSEGYAVEMAANKMQAIKRK